MEISDLLHGSYDAARLLGQALNPFGPTIDPASMAVAGGPTKAPGEEDLVRKFIGKERTPVGKQYEEWSKQHPYQSFAAEQAAGIALNELPYGHVLRRAGLGNIADILDAAAHVGGPIWGEHIQDPKLRMDKVKEARQGVMEEGPEAVTSLYRIHRTSNDEHVGGLKLTYLPDELDKGRGMVYVDYAHILPEYEKEFGTGQLMHLQNQIKEEYPDANWLQFMRTSGKGPEAKGRLEEVVMPLRRRSEMDETAQASYDQFVKNNKGPIKRTTVGTPEYGAGTDVHSAEGTIPLSPYDHETLWLHRHGYLDRYEIPDTELDQLLRENPSEHVWALESHRQEQLLDRHVRASRRGLDPGDESTYLHPDDVVPSREWYMNNVDSLQRRLARHVEGLPPNPALSRPPDYTDLSPMALAKTTDIAQERGISEDEAYRLVYSPLARGSHGL